MSRHSKHHRTPLSPNHEDSTSFDRMYWEFTGIEAKENDFESEPNLASKNHARIRFVAQMAKLVDAPASGAGGCKTVEVRVFFWAPK